MDWVGKHVAQNGFDGMKMGFMGGNKQWYCEERNEFHYI